MEERKTKKIILDLLRDGKERSRHEIAQELGLNVAVVTNHITVLKMESQVKATGKKCKISDIARAAAWLRKKWR